jgi:hypothetical protein
MRLYVCYGTFGGDRHSCAKAYDALREAGHDPEVKRSYGSGMLPDFLNLAEGRREARRRTGSSWVPLLITDDDEAIQGSDQIAAWAHAHPVKS